MINVAHIIGFHGLKGEMKLKSTSDFIADRMQVGNKLWLAKDEEAQEVMISSVRVHNNTYLIKITGFDSLSEVEKYRGYSLQVHEDDLYELADDEYYHFELVANKVYDHQNQLLGTVASIYNNGANDVFIVMTENDKEVHIPFLDAFVENIDLENKIIKLYEVEGLF